MEGKRRRGWNVVFFASREKGKGGKSDDFRLKRGVENGKGRVDIGQSRRTVARGEEGKKAAFEKGGEEGRRVLLYASW